MLHAVDRLDLDGQGARGDASRDAMIITRAEADAAEGVVMPVS